MQWGKEREREKDRQRKKKILFDYYIFNLIFMQFLFLILKSCRVKMQNYFPYLKFEVRVRPTRPDQTRPDPHTLMHIQKNEYKAELLIENERFDINLHWNSVNGSQNYGKIKRQMRLMDQNCSRWILDVDSISVKTIHTVNSHRPLPFSTHTHSAFKLPFAHHLQ